MSYWDGGQLREWRWSSLTDILKALLKRELALKECWNETQFGGHGPGCAANASIRSELFWAYAKFLSIISGTLDSQSQWCEGCSCHQETGKHNAAKARKAYLNKKLQHFGSSRNDQVTADHCPLKGRRAPEFANGTFTEFVEELMRCSEEKLQECIQGVSLTEQDRATVLNDWTAATDAWICYKHGLLLGVNGLAICTPCAHMCSKCHHVHRPGSSEDIILTQVRLKTSCWSCLPWKLAGLGSESPEVARRCGRECLHLFKAACQSSGHAGAFSHPMTRRFLDPVAGLFVTHIMNALVVVVVVVAVNVNASANSKVLNVCVYQGLRTWRVAF